MPTITVQDLLNERSSQLQLTLLAGKPGVSNKIAIPRIQKPALALAGYLPQVHPERIQILGKTELEYLKTLPQEEARQGGCPQCGSDNIKVEEYPRKLPSLLIGFLFMLPFPICQHSCRV